MIGILIGFAATVVFDFAGYWLHRSLHRLPWPWWQRAHAKHHYEEYPPERFLGDAPYRPTGDLSRFLLATVAVGLPICFLFPPAMAIGMLVSLASYSFINEYLHDAFHVRGHWLERVLWFPWLRELHRRHHDDVSTNFGIYTFVWDRLFGTFSDPAL